MFQSRRDLERCLILALAILHALVVVQVKCDSVCFAPSHVDYTLNKRITKQVPDTSMQEICYDLQLFHRVDSSDDTGVQCGKQYFTASLKLGSGWFYSFKTIPKDSELLDMKVSFEPSYTFENKQPRFRPIIVTAESVELNTLAGFWAEICIRSMDLGNYSDPLKVIQYRKITEQAPEGVAMLPKDMAQDQADIHTLGIGTPQVQGCTSGGQGCSVQTSGNNFSSHVTVLGSGSAQVNSTTSG